MTVFMAAEMSRCSRVGIMHPLQITQRLLPELAVEVPGERTSVAVTLDAGQFAHPPQNVRVML
jgi:hypothetical protein